jgi:hypothetical protein
VAFEGEDYPGVWAIVDARLDGWPYADDQIPVFLGDDGFWAMRLPGGWVRLFFRHAGAVPRQGPEEVSRILAQYVPGTVRVLELTGRLPFASISAWRSASASAGCSWPATPPTSARRSAARG